jgi:preprotein translocase subunit SecG
MTVTTVIAAIVFLVAIVALAVLLANGIADEPPATAAERKFWPGDVVEDDGSYDG